MNTKKDHVPAYMYDVRNPGPGLGQAQIRGVVKSTLPLLVCIDLVDCSLTRFQTRGPNGPKRVLSGFVVCVLYIVQLILMRISSVPFFGKIHIRKIHSSIRFPLS